MNQYPNLLLTSSLIFILLPPFLLKTFYPTLEPYPAIILPAGSDTINIKNSRVSFTRTSILAQPKNQAKFTSQVDSSRFLEPIPVHYLKYMTLTSFGLRSPESKSANTWKQKYDSILNSKISSQERVETKNWFKQKLNKLGYIPDKFIVVSEEITFDINTGEVIAQNTIDEKTFNLD